MTKIYLVRHCETEGNVQRVFHGIIDTLPTKDGEKQLDYLAEHFRDIPLDAIYASPLKRTQATAEAVNRYHGLPIKPDRRLIEINGGEIDGMPWKRIIADYPELGDVWMNALHDFSTQKGESMRDVYARAHTTLRDMADKNRGKSIALATHGGFIKNILCWLKFGDITHLMEIPWPENASVTLLEFDENLDCKIVYDNDFSFLPEALQSFRNNIWSKDDLK